jgi:hypothetical protein
MDKLSLFSFLPSLSGFFNLINTEGKDQVALEKIHGPPRFFLAQTLLI